MVLMSQQHPEKHIERFAFMMNRCDEREIEFALHMIEQILRAVSYTHLEQDGMVVTLGNWLNGRLSCEQIEQLWCELIIPEKNKEQKESEE